MLKPHRALTAILMVAALWTTSACASQTYGYRGGGNGGYGREIERRGYDFGYRDGLNAGERDGRSGRSFLFNRHDDWRDADAGYRGDYGNRERYRRSFRSGFESGYTEAYNRYGGYGRSPRATLPTYPTYPNDRNGRVVPRGSYSPAAQNGYRDGLEAGRDDGRSQHAFDPIRARRYREGDHDYDNRYGSRDEYKREYRSAFTQGYEDGYRGRRP